MNIFVTDPDHRECVKALDDKRVVKMVLESTQLLCTAINEKGGKTPYRSTHINHPCSIWTRETFGNWLWLYDYAFALCQEYTYRYGKEHKCEKVLWSLQWPWDYFQPGERTAFVNCTGKFNNLNNVYWAYKKCLKEKWDNDKRPPKWTKRKEPDWKNK